MVTISLKRNGNLNRLHLKIFSRLSSPYYLQLMSEFPLALEKLETGKMREVFPVMEKSGKKIQKVLEKSGNLGQSEKIMSGNKDYILHGKYKNSTYIS